MEAPKCPNCNKKCSISGTARVGSGLNYWTCFDCGYKVEDIECIIEGIKCIGNNKIKNPNFKKDVFDKKVDKHIKLGYSRELAEWKVLGDFNRLFFKFLGVKPNKRKTDSSGYYI